MVSFISFAYHISKIKSTNIYFQISRQSKRTFFLIGQAANLKIDWFFFRFIWYLLRYLQKKIAEKYRFRYLFLTHAFFRLGSNGGYGNNNNNYGGKKKSKKMSTLKKAAVLGAVAYGSYQIGKMSSGYGGWNNHPRG